LDIISDGNDMGVAKMFSKDSCHLQKNVLSPLSGVKSRLGKQIASLPDWLTLKMEEIHFSETVYSCHVHYSRGLYCGDTPTRRFFGGFFILSSRTATALVKP
jgi:hypothetical protein